APIWSAPLGLCQTYAIAHRSKSSLWAAPTARACASISRRRRAATSNDQRRLLPVMRGASRRTWPARQLRAPRRWIPAGRAARREEGCPEVARPVGNVEGKPVFVPRRRDAERLGNRTRQFVEVIFRVGKRPENTVDLVEDVIE